MVMMPEMKLIWEMMHQRDKLEDMKMVVQLKREVVKREMQKQRKTYD
jgi:hypothetical protein